LLHWQLTAHHHHDDGSVAVDDSGESIQHVVADGCLGAMAVWLILSLTVAPARTELALPLVQTTQSQGCTPTAHEDLLD
jgi:hypothetical protein